jgi:ribosomal protein S18 acetylase RimI-like enzyme
MVDADADALMRARITLRPIARSDLKTLTRMAVAFNAEDGHPLTAAGRRALKLLCEGTPHGLGFMVEHHGDAVGYIVVGLGFSIEFGGVDGFLDEFYVEPVHRARGLGTAAMEQLGKLARRRKIKALHLEAMPQNDRAARLYERLGYRVSDRRLMSKRY